MNAPKISISAGGVAALLVVGYLAYKLWVNPNLLNPLSDKNAAYTTANDTLAAITGDKVDTVGTWLANIFQPSAQADGFQPTVKLPPNYSAGG